MRKLLLVSVLCLHATACLKTSSKSETDSSHSPDRAGLLVRCEKRIEDEKSVKGANLQIFVVAEPLNVDSKGIALGFDGRWNEYTSLRHSQGDQPTFVKASKKDENITFSTAETPCTSRCGNQLVLSSGGGENEEAEFVTIKKVTFDQHDGRVKLEGSETIVNDSQKSTPWKAVFDKCDFKKSALKDTRSALDKFESN